MAGKLLHELHVAGQQQVQNEGKEEEEDEQSK